MRKPPLASLQDEGPCHEIQRTPSVRVEFERFPGLLDRLLVRPLELAQYPAHVLQGPYREAIEQSRKALELDPHSWRALYFMARALILAERPEEALLTVHRAEDPPALLRATAARALVALGKYHEARRVLRASSNGRPSDTMSGPKQLRRSTSRWASAS